MLRRTLLTGAALGLVAGCSTTATPSEMGATRREIDGAVDAALGELYTAVPTARTYTDAARGVLVIPNMFNAGLIIGATYGRGALRKRGTHAAYYSVGGGSVGLLAGAQSRTLFLLFMSPEALAQFEAKDSWEAGAEASVVALDAAATAGSNNPMAHGPIVAFVRSNQGLMANLSFAGVKFTRLQM